MDYAPRDDLPSSYKILVAGGFGVGKTTLVGSISEIPPLITEELLTGASVGVDDTDGVELALNLDPAIPVRHFDARRRGSVKTILIDLVQHLMTQGEN